jgi:hypothetical protein
MQVIPKLAPLPYLTPQNVCLYCEKYYMLLLTTRKTRLDSSVVLMVVTHKKSFISFGHILTSIIRPAGQLYVFSTLNSGKSMLSLTHQTQN